MKYILYAAIAAFMPLAALCQKIIFQDNFQNPPVFNNGNPALGYTNWDETCCPWSFTNSDSFGTPARSGRFELRKSDPSPQPNDSKRSQMEWNGFAVPMGAVWYAMDIMPAAWMGIDPAPEDLFDLHDRMPGGASSNWTNPFGIWNKNGRWTAHITYSVLPVTAQTIKNIEYDLGPVAPGKFVNWVLHTNYSWRDSGFVEVYKDGIKVIDYKGPCAYNGAMPDPYFKFGVYKWPWDLPNFQPPSTQILRVFYFDNFKVGNRNATLADMLPMPVNQAPKADAGPDQTLTGGVTSTTLQGNGTDADGTITAYGWRMFLPVGSTLVSSQQNWTIYGFTPGKYGAELTVTDNNGAKAVDTVYVTVQALNTAPIISPIATTNVVIPVAFFTLTGNATDREGDAITYSWKRPDGTISQGKAITDTLRAAGVYVYQLTATDAKGLASTTDAIVNVAPIPPKLIIKVEININPKTGGYIITKHHADGTEVSEED